FCLPAARRPHRALHSFPTRRSSDLGIELGLDRSVIPYPDEDVTAAFTGQVVGHRADRLTDDVQVLDHPFELQGAGLLGSQFGGEFALHHVRFRMLRALGAMKGESSVGQSRYDRTTEHPM